MTHNRDRLLHAQVFAVGDSRAHEVVLNSLMQPVVHFVPWVTRTNIQALGDLKGARMVLPPRF
jgi:hypothetical protein